MKVIDRLATQADQRDRLDGTYSSGMDIVKHNEGRGTRMYRKGFKTARAMAIRSVEDSLNKYWGLPFQEAWEKMLKELDVLGEEEEGP